MIFCEHVRGSDLMVAVGVSRSSFLDRGGYDFFISGFFGVYYYLRVSKRFFVPIWRINRRVYF